jgi:hypothetical protein
MSSAPDITPDSADWPERRLAMLSDLAQAAVDIALALKTRILETAAAEPEADAPAACADLTRAFDRAARSARMAIALRERLETEAVAPSASSAPSAATLAREARDLRAGRVRRIVGRIALARCVGPDARDDMDRQARERLFDPDITGDLEGRSLGELVARICADLGLTPPWRSLAEEAWAQTEILQRPEGSPYAAWPDLPPDPPDPFDDGPDDDDDRWDPDDDADEDDGGPSAPAAPKRRSG